MPPPAHLPFRYRRRLIARRRDGRRRLWGFTGHTALRWALTALLGALCGCGAFTIVELSNLLQSAGAAVCGRPDGSAKKFLAFSMWNCAWAASASALALRVAPSALGAGVSEVSSRRLCCVCLVLSPCC